VVKQLAGLPFGFIVGVPQFFDPLVELGTDRAFRGDYDSALEEYRLAGEAYQRAAEIARSDASIHEGDCARWAQVLETEVRRGGRAQPAFESALSSCGRSLD